jgi:phosphoesterase RecJ-like protein
MRSPISKDIAASIYTGILTDTGSFRFSNTNRFSFEICAEMVDIGADPCSISKNIYETYSLGYIKLLNMALDSIEISGNGKLCLMTVTKEMLDKTGALPEETNGIINYGIGIKNIKIAALVKELNTQEKYSKQQDRFHVSLRSDGDFDVAAFASSFGGGGHRRAAGFNFKSSITDLKKHFSNLVEEV